MYMYSSVFRILNFYSDAYPQKFNPEKQDICTSLSQHQTDIGPTDCNQLILLQTS